MNLNFILQSMLNGLLIGGVYGLCALGLTLIYGVMKIVNFAHGTLMMLGMFTTYWAFTLLHVDPYVSIPIVLFISFIIGALFYKFLINPIINASHHNILLLTMGVSLFLQNLAVFLWSPDYRVLRSGYEQINFYIGDVSLSLTRLLAFVFAMAFAAILYIVLHKTDLGRAIRATSEEPMGSELVGINTRYINWITFGIGTACVGMAGTVVATFFPIYPYVGDIFVLVAYVVVVLGGLGSFAGALVGGVIIGVADSLGAVFFPGGMKSIMSFMIFILILLFKPRGLFGKINA